MKSLFICLFLTMPLVSQENAFKVSVEKNIKLASQFRIIVESLKGGPIVSISTESFNNKDFELLKVSKTSDRTLEIDAIPFAIGISTFPPIDFYCDGEKKQTPSILLKIEPYFSKTDGKIKDIYPPLFFLNIYKLIFWILLALALFFLIKKFLSKRSISHFDQNVKVETRTPYEKALYEISELEKKAKENFIPKEFYDELSDIFRNYISDRYNINAPKMTTQDSMKALRDNFKDFTILSRIRETLDIADLAKFARYSDSIENAVKNLASVKDLISNLEELKIEEEREKINEDLNGDRKNAI